MHEKMKIIDFKGARKIPHSQIPSSSFWKMGSFQCI